MKRIIALTAALCLCAPMDAAADDAKTITSKQKGYTLTCAVNDDGKSVTVTAVEADEETTAISLPRTIEGYTAAAVGAGAFAGCINAEKITLPSTVKSLGDGAFMSCTMLSEISAAGVTAVPDDCFFACPKLTAVKFSDKLAYIGSEAFFGCTLLEMTVPDTVLHIGENALGIEAESHSGKMVPVRGFLIFGKKGSIAEKYAEENSIDFLDPDDFKLGDVNGDDMIDASDASDVLVEYSRVSTGAPGMFTKKQRIMGNMNGDELIDATDASDILGLYAQLSTSGN